MTIDLGKHDVAPLVARGCGLPAMVLIQARHMRDQVLEVLWPADEEKQQALVQSCNLHPEAAWWIEHESCAEDLIAAAGETLLSWRQRGSDHHFPAQEPW